MQPQDLFHLLTNGFYRVERITGILRDQLMLTRAGGSGVYPTSR